MVIVSAVSTIDPLSIFAPPVRVTVSRPSFMTSFVAPPLKVIGSAPKRGRERARTRRMMVRFLIGR